MNKRNYMFEVDALCAPAALRAKIAALSGNTSGARRPRRAVPSRLLPIAAALVLVVGLGLSAPYLFPTLFTGGELTPPPVATEAPAISDEELTELLAAQIPDIQGNEQFTLLTSAGQNGRTLGILRYAASAHANGLGNLYFGTFDNRTKQLVDGAVIKGDKGNIYAWYGDKQDSIIRILWTNYTEYQGRQDCSAGLYTFYDGILSVTKELPKYRLSQGATLPEGGDTMFDADKNTDFWTDRKAVFNGGGLSIYQRNPEYAAATQDADRQWIFEFNIVFNFGEKSYVTVAPDVEPPELRVDGEALFIRYPGETAWEEVLPMLPMPAQRHAPAIDGLTSMTEFPRDNLYFGFTSPTEGWLALGGNGAVWLPYNYIYLTHDGGHTWVEATGDLNDQCTMFLNCAVFSDESHGFLGYRYEWGGNAPLYWTEDGGRSWKPYDMNILPLPTDDNTIYEPTDITFDGSEGTFAFTRHTRDDLGQPIETKLTVALTDYGTGIQLDTVPVFEAQLSPYAIKSSQLPYGDPNVAWMGGYETQPLRPLARLEDAGIDLYGLNENWCGTKGVLLVRDRDMSTAVWYVLPYDRAIGSCSLALSDYDGDGQDELAMVLSMSSGTGVAEYNLYMVELEGRGFRFCAIFDESSHPLILEALGGLGGEEYDQFGQWQIYSLEDGAIHMELGVHGKDIPPYIWQGMLTADVGWDGDSETFSLENAKFSKIN